jgi:nicotinamide-nucleotide adenylyltransferase
MKGTKKALFIGRFQPFHNGHLKVIKDILRASGRITIVIGGPAKPDERNPFSFAERERMIRLALGSEGISNCEIRKVADVNNNDEWNAKIKRLGKFDVAYSRNPWVARCLKKIGMPVIKHAFYERYKNCGRVIRERIAEGKEWKSLVPAAVYEYIKKLKGEERISRL